MTTYEKYKNNIITCQEYMEIASPIIFEIIRNESSWYALTDEQYLNLIKESHDIKEFAEYYRKDIINLFGKEIDYTLLEKAYYYRIKKLQREFKPRDTSRTILENNSNKLFIDVASNRGLTRKNNEDTVAAINQNNTTMLIICDGVGGDEHSEKASKIVIEEFVKWFRRTKINKENITKDINAIIRICSNLINKYCKYASTTLTIAITIDDYAYFYNIGDSRGYILNHQKLKQITEDESEVWPLYKNGRISKDELRFMLHNNIITNCLSSQIPNNLLNPQIVKEYDGIMLCTDGITDVLSDTELESLIKTTEEQQLLDRIITEANFKKMESPVETEENYNLELKSIRPGLDNQSIAYLKKK